MGKAGPRNLGQEMLDAKIGLWSALDWGTVRAELSSFPTCLRRGGQ